ncbi:MAG TPA: GntR family transcriptional regulator [Pseudonocardiaceae bacterium]
MTNKTPQYRRLADLLRRRIDSGQWPPGSRLPSETDLITEFASNRSMIRRALAVLRTDGLIITRPRHGSYVRPAIPPRTVHLPVAPGPGHTVQARMPTADEAREHHVPAGTPLLVVTYPDGHTRYWRADRVVLLHTLDLPDHPPDDPPDDDQPDDQADGDPGQTP